MFGEHFGDEVVTTHPSASSASEEGQPGTGRKLRRAGPSGGERLKRLRNIRNPMVGSTVQQTCRVEEA